MIPFTLILSSNHIHKSQDVCYMPDENLSKSKISTMINLTQKQSKEKPKVFDAHLSSHSTLLHVQSSPPSILDNPRV